MKPDRARAIEQLLARMAQSGQLRGRVSEDQLIDVLDQVRPWRVLFLLRSLAPAVLLTLSRFPGWFEQVEAMEKGQSGATGSKSASKITVSRPEVTLDCAHPCSDPKCSPAAVTRVRSLHERRRTKTATTTGSTRVLQLSLACIHCFSYAFFLQFAFSAT